MSNLSWCNVTELDWSALTPDGWDPLAVCVGRPAEAYYYDGPVPSTIQSNPLLSSFMRDYPIDSTGPAGAKSPNSVVYESGQFQFARELLSIPSIGNFRWTFGISYQGDSEADDILGRKWAYPQLEHLEAGLGDYRKEVNADRPLAYWQLDEQGSPNQAADAQGLANGLYFGSPWVNKTPAIGTGSSVEFRGNPMRIDVPAIAALDLKPGRHPFALEVWAQKLDDLLFTGTLLAKGAGSQCQYAITVNEVVDEEAGTSTITFTGTVGGNSVSKTMSSDEAWHHLVLVNRCKSHEGQGEFEFNLFVDGGRVGDWQASGSQTTTRRLRIGAATDTDGAAINHLQGRLDEVAIYDRSLSPDRITCRYTIAHGTGDPLQFIRKVTGQQTIQVFSKVSPEPGQPSQEIYRGPGATLRHVTVQGTVPGHYTLTSADGSEARFDDFTSDTPGCLRMITDRFGNSQSYEYWSTPTIPGRTRPLTRLSKVRDPYGRAIDYYYYSNDPNGGYLLQEISDFVGRTVNFQYQSQRLVAVILPRIPDAATGNAFPNGTAYVFKYDSAGRLIQVFYPNEVDGHVSEQAGERVVDVAAVYASATPRISVDYYADGRVRGETVGGAGAGGTWRFNYQTLAEADSDPFWASCERARTRTVVTDPNGNETAHDFNQYRLPVRVEVRANRSKLTMQGGPQLTAPPYVTYVAHNHLNQPRVVVLPERNSVEYDYETGEDQIEYASGKSFSHGPLAGQLTSETHRYDNRFASALPVSRPNGGVDSRVRYFAYEPIFNQLCASVDFSGNRTLQYYDYQELDLNGIGSAFAAKMFPEDPTDGEAKVRALVNRVIARTNDAPFAWAFETNLGDSSGDGTANQVLGSLIGIRHPLDLIEVFTVNDRGLVTTHTDPDGVVTALVRHPERDPDGDGHVDNPDATTRQLGWVKAVYRDVSDDDVKSLTGLANFTRKVSRASSAGPYLGVSVGYPRYDPLGNPVVEVDPRGGETATSRTATGEPYHIDGPAASGMPRFKRDLYYDANRNPIRVEVEDRVVHLDSGGGFTPSLVAEATPTAEVPTDPGSGGALRSGYFTVRHEYDLLDRLRYERVEATGSPASTLVTQHEYDANGNVVRVTKPAGNTVEYDYDERNLRIAERLGYQDASHAGSVTVYAYDANGNLRHAIGPVDHNPDGATHATAVVAAAFGSSAALTHTGDWASEHVYDGHDRLLKAIDALGNTAMFESDVEGRVVQRSDWGPAGGPSRTTRSETGNEELSRVTYEYDEAGRSRRSTHVSLSPDDGEDLVTTHEFDRAGRVTQATDPGGRINTVIYDGLGRSIAEVDPAGNRVDREYDAAGNVTRVVHTEVSEVRTMVPETFEERYRYDAMGRMVIASHQGVDGTIAAMPGGTQTLDTYYGYDSRGNMTVTVDPAGRATRHAYDGAGRLLSSTTNVNGTDVTTVRESDENGRLRSLTDANLNVTLFKYDALDRLLKTTYADDLESSHRHEWTYDAAGPVGYADGAGSTFAFTHDAAGRKAGTTLTLASGVLGTTAQSWEYDGLSRTTLLYDDDANDAGLGDGAIRLTYDSLGRLRRERVGQVVDDATEDRDVSYANFDVLAPKSVTYPNGRELAFTYDRLHRATSVTNASGDEPVIASWAFVGASRVLHANLANGIECRYRNDAASHSAAQAATGAQPWGQPCDDRMGYDGAGRMIGKRYTSRCAGAGIGTERYMTRQRAAQNATSWDFPRGHAFLSGAGGATAGFQHMAWQIAPPPPSAVTWDFSSAHPAVVPPPPDQKMVDQVLTPDTADFAFVKAPNKG